jgi:hypothetical protein
MKDLRRFGYQLEHHDRADSLRVAAAAAAGNSVVQTRINISLAIRKAVRRDCYRGRPKRANGLNSPTTRASKDHNSSEDPS